MKHLLVIICLATLVLIGFHSRPAYASGETYVVQPGDTLFTIAARYNISVNDLAAVNGLNSGLWVYAGQQLIIPTSTPFAAPPAYAEAAHPYADPQAAGFAPLPTAPTFTGTYTVQPGDTLYNVAHRYGVSLADLQAANGFTDLSLPIYSGQQLLMPAPAVDSSQESILIRPALAAPPNLTNPGWTNGAVPPQPWAAYPAQPQNFYGSLPYGLPSAPFPAQPAHPAAFTRHTEKWIDVDLTRQILTAFEGQRSVFHTRISSGLPQYPTVAGTFSIYVKYEAADMSGGFGDDTYYLPSVPYVMYFHGNYGLHGTYWHNNFGTPMSHGCVNLSTPAAEWLFNWAPIGTKVVTHY